MNLSYLYGNDAQAGIADHFYRSILAKSGNASRAATFRHFCECITDDHWSGNNKNQLLLSTSAQFVVEQQKSITKHQDLPLDEFKLVMLKTFRDWHADWWKRRSRAYVQAVLKSTKSLHQEDLSKIPVQEQGDPMTDAALDAISEYMKTATPTEKVLDLYLRTGGGIKWEDGPHPKYKSAALPCGVVSRAAFYRHLKAFKSKLKAIASKHMNNI